MSTRVREVKDQKDEEDHIGERTADVRESVNENIDG